MSQWYYQLLGEEFGPVSAESLRELMKDGTISESDPVRPVDSADWQPASSYSELQGSDDAVISDLSELSFEFEESGPTARKAAYGAAAAAPAAPAAPVPPAETGFYYQVQGVSLGPIPLQSLQQLASGGRLLESDLVREAGAVAWRAALEYSELAVVFAAMVPLESEAAPAEDSAVAEQSVVSEAPKSAAKPSAKPAAAGKGRKKGGRGAKEDTSAVDDILNEVFADEEPQPVRRPGLYSSGGAAAEPAGTAAPAVSAAPAPAAPAAAPPMSAVGAAAAAAAKNYAAPAKSRKSSGGGVRLEFGTPAKVVLGLVLAGVLFMFSDPLLKLFKSDYDRYARRTELAIQTIEALNPKTQLVAYKGQMMSVEKEIGAYAAAIKAGGTPSAKNKHLLDALEKMLEFAKMDPKDADKQKQAVSDAKGLIQKYRGG